MMKKIYQISMKQILQMLMGLGSDPEQIVHIAGEILTADHVRLCFDLLLKSLVKLGACHGDAHEHHQRAAQLGLVHNGGVTLNDPLLLHPVDPL